MISCLIFDLDGTLFDSSAANVAAYSVAFAKTGVEFNEARYRQEFGLRFSEMMDAIAPDAIDDQRQKIKKLKAMFYQDNLDLVTPNRPLLEFLKSAKLHYRTALVTTASRVNVTNLLDHFLVGEKLFDVIITGENVKNGKPDPECYRLAIKKLGKSPHECLIFEDSAVGMEAAQKSGAQVVKVAM